MFILYLLRKDISLNFLRTVLYVLLVASSSLSMATEYILLKSQVLAKQKVNFQKAKKQTSPYFTDIFALANKALKAPAYSVTDKTLVPPSGDLHDYLSISRYWWPDQSKADGLPWIRRDGVTNPSSQTDDVDRKRLGSMVKSVKALALAYYYSEDAKYAEKAAQFLRVWFISPNTKMNPHLQYAQSVPGHHKARRSGILDGRLIPESLLDAISLIAKSTAWTEEDQRKINTWLHDYLTWLSSSKLGKSGAKQENNHGSWYHFQVTALAYYLQDSQALEQSIAATKKHISAQFDENGAQPHELSRTRSYFYSTFNLDALVSIAKIAQNSGESLWHYPSKEHSILMKAVEFLIPAANGETWPYPERNFKRSDLQNVLQAYIEHYPAPQHQALLDSLSAE